MSNARPLQGKGLQNVCPPAPFILLFTTQVLCCPISNREGVLKGYRKIGDQPQKVLSNPPKCSIEPLKRFHRTPFWTRKWFYRTPMNAFQNDRQGSVEPFASNPPFSGYPFGTFSLIGHMRRGLHSLTTLPFFEQGIF